MAPLRSVILALLLAIAGPAAAVPSSAPSTLQSAPTAADVQVYEPANTSAMMTLGEDAEETRAFVQPSLDVGTSLHIQKQSMSYRLNSRSFERQFNQLDSRGDKRDLLLKFATEIDTKTLALESHEATARRGFRNGSISADEYLTTLFIVSAESKHIIQDIRAAENLASGVKEFSLSGYFGTYQKRLISLRGPVREGIGPIATGEMTVNRYYLSAAENGVVLASIKEGTYHREVYRVDHRKLESNNQYNSSAISNRRNQFYPWAAPDSGNFKGSGLRPNAIGGYTSFDLEHTHGKISGYFDLSTGLVFRESQMKYLTTDAASRNGLDATRPKGPGVTANESGLLLTVNRSYPGGPMYVSLQDNETGDLIEGSIAINGKTVGQTKFGSGLWVLSPAGSFNVSASSGLDVVTVETRATRPLATRNTTQT